MGGRTLWVARLHLGVLSPRARRVRATAWGKDNPTFRQVFTSRFIPGGSQQQLRWFNDLCLNTTTGETVASLFEARAVVDIVTR